MFVDFCLGKEWGTIFVFRKNSHNFHNCRVSCPFWTTRVLKCFRFLGAESDRNQSSQPLQKGIGLVIFQWFQWWSPAPYAYIYIIRFFSTIKYMKYNYTHTSSQKLKVYEKDFAFFFPYSQKQLLKKTFNRRPMSCQPLRTADLKMWKDSRKSAAKILSPFTCLRWFFAKTGKPKTVWL